MIFIAIFLGLELLAAAWAGFFWLPARVRRKFGWWAALTSAHLYPLLKALRFLNELVPGELLVAVRKVRFDHPDRPDFIRTAIYLNAGRNTSGWSALAETASMEWWEIFDLVLGKRLALPGVLNYLRLKTISKQHWQVNDQGHGWVNVRVDLFFEEAQTTVYFHRPYKKNPFVLPSYLLAMRGAGRYRDELQGRFPGVTVTAEDLFNGPLGEFESNPASGYASPD